MSFSSTPSQAAIDLKGALNGAPKEVDERSPTFWEALQKTKVSSINNKRNNSTPSPPLPITLNPNKKPPSLAFLRRQLNGSMLTQTNSAREVPLIRIESLFNSSYSLLTKTHLIQDQMQEVPISMVVSYLNISQ